MSDKGTPYDPIDQTGVVVDGLDIGAVVGDIHKRGYTVVENFLVAEEVDRMRVAFDTEVLITEMKALGTSTGRTWRAHNLLAKPRATDFVFLDPRFRAIVDGVIGQYSQLNIATLFNTLPGETRQGLHQVLPCLLEEVLRVFH